MTQQPYRANKTSANRAHYLQSAGATLVLVILLGVFIRAGVWQLDRAGEKEDMKSTFAAQSIVAPSATLLDDTAAKKARFWMFKINGYYDNEQQILLDNMTSKGQNGYQILTPFFVGDMTVLINRGWIKANPDRTKLPDVEVSNEPRTILTRLNNLPEPGIRLPATETQSGPWPRRLLFPTRDQISDNLGYPVLDYQLMLDPAALDGFHRDWKPLEIGPEKNLGYAFQWFSFALMTLIVYIALAVRWSRHFKKQQA